MKLIQAQNQQQLKFTVGQRVMRNPEDYEKIGRTPPTWVGIIVACSSKGYRVRKSGDSCGYLYTEKELVPAK